MLPSLAPSLAPARRALSLFLGLALFPSLAVTAFTTSNSPPTQCGPFIVIWGGPNQTPATPFTLLVLPLDGSPTILRLPDSSFNATTNTGKYTLDKLPLKSATKFVLTMDDSSGRGTGGVSLIQTVGDSSDASCLTTEVSTTSSFFTPNPANPSQCSLQTLSWNSTRYREPPDIRGFIPGGQAFTLDRPSSNSTTQVPWEVHIREGTQFVFLAQPAASTQNFTGNSDARTSPLITVTGKSSQGDSCLNTGSPSSTTVLSMTGFTPTFPATSTPTAPAVSGVPIPTVPGTTDPGGNVKVAAITGGIVGGLGFMAIVCASFVLYRSFKRRNKTQPPRKRGIGLSSYGSNNQPRSKSSRNEVRSSLAGITIASTQVSRGTRATSTNMMNEFGASLGGDNGTTHTAPPGIISATAMHKPPLNTQGRTEYPPPPPRPSRSAVLPLSYSPIISVADDASVAYAYNVPMVDEKRTELGDVLTQSHPDPSRDEYDRTPEPEHEHEHERQPWSAHPYAHPLASVNPAPPPVRRGSARSPSSPGVGVGVWGEDDDSGGRDGEGDQAVNEEYAFGSRRGLSMRARVDGAAGNVYGGSRGNRTRTRENELGTEYVRHTDAGAVRVVELPPLYHDLRR